MEISQSLQNGEGFLLAYLATYPPIKTINTMPFFQVIDTSLSRIKEYLPYVYKLANSSDGNHACTHMYATPDTGMYDELQLERGVPISVI